MTRRKQRIHPRYPVRLRVRLTVRDTGESRELEASDVTSGGVFLVTTDPPEIFSEVDAILLLPG